MKISPTGASSSYKASDNDGMPLERNVDRADESTARALLEGSCDPLCFRSPPAQMLFHRAAGCRQGEMAVLPERSAASPEALDNRLHTPLMAAALRNDAVTLTLLLKAGAAVNAPNPEGETALTVAIQKGHLQIIAILLSAGATIRCEDYQDALICHRFNAIRLLLVYDTSPDIRVSLDGGRTTLSLFDAILVDLYTKTADQRLCIAGLLLSNNTSFESQADHNALLRFACHTGDVELAQQAIARGAAVNHRASGCLPPIKAACSLRSPHLVRLLLDHQAPIGAFFDEKDKTWEDTLFSILSPDHGKPGYQETLNALKTHPRTRFEIKKSLLCAAIKGMEYSPETSSVFAMDALGRAWNVCVDFELINKSLSPLAQLHIQGMQKTFALSAQGDFHTIAQRIAEGGFVALPVNLINHTAMMMLYTSGGKLFMVFGNKDNSYFEDRGYPWINQLFEGLHFFEVTDLAHLFTASLLKQLCNKQRMPHELNQLITSQRCILTVPRRRQTRGNCRSTHMKALFDGAILIACTQKFGFKDAEFTFLDHQEQAYKTFSTVYRALVLLDFVNDKHCPDPNLDQEAFLKLNQWAVQSPKDMLDQATQEVVRFIKGKNNFCETQQATLIRWMLSELKSTPAAQYLKKKLLTLSYKPI